MSPNVTAILSTDSMAYLAAVGLRLFQSESAKPACNRPGAYVGLSSFDSRRTLNIILYCRLLYFSAVVQYCHVNLSRCYSHM